MTKKLTPEKFASVPTLIQQGLRKAQIAEQFGVTPGTLQVQCSKRNISLRPGGRRCRTLALSNKALSLSDITLTALRTKALAMGIDEVKLASTLLETITKDDLYRAVLDLESVA